MIFCELENIRKKKRDNPKVVSLLSDSLNRLKTDFSSSGVPYVLINHFHSDVFRTAGEKVQKKVTNGSNIQTTEYLDGFQYNNNLLEFFPHAEGYVKVTAMGINPNNPQYAYNYVFNYTDHLDKRIQSTALNEVCERSSVRVS